MLSKEIRNLRARRVKKSEKKIEIKEKRKRRKDREKGIKKRG